MNVQIVNWLLTRRCNLKCELCRIYNNNSIDMSMMRIQQWLDVLERKFKPFHILYGGEPFMRDDIVEVLKLFQEYCPDRFTIYHNATMIDKVTKIAKDLGLKRITASIDPAPKDKFRQFKSQHGIQFLKQVDFVEDRVATITIDKQTAPYIVDTVEMLTDLGVYSNITTFDPPGGSDYDFSVNDSRIVEQCTVYKHHVEDAFNEIKERALKGELLVHFPELLDKILESLPRNYRCYTPWSSLTIDSDGTTRLCLRIGGTCRLGPETIDTGYEYAMHIMKEEQNRLCNGCVWTCIMMSEMTLDVRKHETD